MTKGQKNKADRLFSLKVRELGYCQLQGKDKIRCSQVLQCAHIIGRANLRLRWDFLNALCICSGHHVWYTHEPEAWRNIVKKEFPENWEYVNKNRNDIWDKNIERVLNNL